MSKFTSLLLILLGLSCATRAQNTNLQLLYDFGEDREYLTSTVEFFKIDDYGRTFFFVDMNYDANGVSGVSESYFEFARSFDIADDLPIGLHFEYNGGQGQFATPDGNQAYTINNAYLSGLDFYWTSEDFTKAVTLQLLYKYIEDKNDDAYQITTVWFASLLEGKVTVNGFADFWREDNSFGDKTTDYVFLSEPQFWYNLNPNIAVGSEIEFGYNFGGTEGWKVCPTVAAKFTF
ncbi:DUF5020 family protein [Kiritimatiellaeota bacterium B1221]|nr:DUF5020 family protein [Kiritimatiellaeota bacterium B1221]